MSVFSGDFLEYTEVSFRVRITKENFDSTSNYYVTYKESNLTLVKTTIPAPTSAICRSGLVYNGELQEDTTTDEEPAAKMRVVEWQTEEETMEILKNTCSSMWGELSDWVCNLEDWSTIAF